MFVHSLLPLNGGIKLHLINVEDRLKVEIRGFFVVFMPQLIGEQLGFTEQKGGNIEMMVTVNPAVWGRFLNKIVQI